MALEGGARRYSKFHASGGFEFSTSAHFQLVMQFWAGEARFTYGHLSMLRSILRTFELLVV